MSYPITTVPSSIGFPDRCLLKNNKALLMSEATKDMSPANETLQKETLLIIDGNATIQALVQVPPIFFDIGKSVLHFTPKHCQTTFSTDLYHPNSMKTLERKRQGEGKRLILGGKSSKKRHDWKSFLSNSQNKEQLNVNRTYKFNNKE